MRFPKILLTTAVIAFSGAAFAQGYHGGGGHHGDELFHGIGLNDAQKTQMKTIEQAGWAQAKPTMEQVRAIHEQIVARMLAPGNVTAADLAPLMTQEEQLRTQLDELKLSTGLQMRAVLTTSQLADAAAKHTQLVSLHEQERAVVDPADSSK